MIVFVLVTLDRGNLNSIEEGIVTLDGCGSAATLNDWSLCLIGRLFGSMPSPAWLKRAVSFLWKTKAGVDVLPMDEHTLCFKLHSEDEQMKALIGGPWTLGGQLLCLEEWSMEACKRKETSRMLPVWLRIPAFPACLWNKRKLASVAAAAGTPIWMDKETAERSRLTYARIKVVVDCAKKPPEGVWVSFRGFQFWQQLSYGSMPSWCSKCNKLGHLSVDCSSSDTATIPVSSGEPQSADTSLAALPSFSARADRVEAPPSPRVQTHVTSSSSLIMEVSVSVPPPSPSPATREFSPSARLQKKKSA